MLLDIRDKAQSWIAWVIVILISIPFAFWGINSYFGGGGAVVVAKINDAEITLDQYQTALSEQRRRLREQLGPDFNSQILQNPQTRRAILDNMINDRLLRQYLEDAGYAVDNAAIEAEIKTIAQFKKDGVFDKKLYKRLVNSQGMSLRQFEGSIRNDLLLKQFTDTMINSTFILPYEIDEFSSLALQKRSVKTLVLNKSMVRLDPAVTADEIAAAYRKEQAAFYTPEAVKISYVELKLADLAKEVKVAEQLLKDLYAQNKQSLKATEERRLSHIMLAGNSADNREKINKIKAKLDAGEDFAQLARDYSEDPGTSAQGGDLGFYAPGELGPAIDAALFKLKINEISQPVTSSYGYHLVKLTDIKQKAIDSFADAKPKLAAEQQQRQAREIFIDKAEMLANLAYEEADSLKAIISEVGLALKKTDWISRDYAEDPLLANPKVKAAIFSDSVLKRRENSAVLQINDEHMLVLRVDEHKKRTAKTLAQAKDEITAAIIKARLNNALKTKAEGIIKSLRQGKDPEQLASSWSKLQEFSRDGSELSGKIFSMPVPSTKAVYDHFGTADKRTVIALFKVTGEVDDKTKREIAGAYKNQIQDMNFASFITQLRNEADLKTFTSHILEN